VSKRAREALGQVPLFANLAARHVRRIADLCGEEHYMAGATIVREGDIGDTFYVVLEGEAKVVNASGRVINRILPGGFFGEISLLDGGPRTASVIAETPMTMLTLGRKDFQGVLASEPAVAVKILARIAGILRQATHPVTA
jgi:CRP-like cAMP-binding protein